MKKNGIDRMPATVSGRISRYSVVPLSRSRSFPKAHPIFMQRWRQLMRFFAAIQLLPALESGEETTLVGGQAVLEGVMMRSPHAWGIAVRKPSGEIVKHSEPLDRPSEKHKWMGWPVLRGLVTLGQAMSLGFRALKFSANVLLAGVSQEQEKQKAAGASAKAT